MLDFSQLARQLSEFSTYRAEEEYRRQEQLRQALQQFHALPEPAVVNAHVKEVNPSWLVALLREPASRVYPEVARPEKISVVATDGSQIFPDRELEPTCYLLNIGRVAFHYGTSEPPLMESIPELHYREDELAVLFDDLNPTLTTELISALRDEQELRQLLNTAKDVRKGWPLVALADGTLIRWMLRKMQYRDLEERFIQRYTALLNGFQEEEIPLCSYISAPASTEVINVLRVFNQEYPGAENKGAISFAGLTDRRLFEHLLKPGERSAIFESSSHIQRAYGEHAICFFYLYAGAEVARVEFPRWVADHPVWVDWIHAVLLDQVRKGAGYPVALAEAHEQAVVRGNDRELFYLLMERQMRHRGFGGVRLSKKQMAKRIPRA